MTYRPHLTKGEKVQVAAIAAELDRWGFVHEIDRAGHHPFVRVTAPESLGGGCYRLPFSSTPKNDDQATDHARQNVRRLVRAINQGLGL